MGPDEVCLGPNDVVVGPNEVVVGPKRFAVGPEGPAAPVSLATPAEADARERCVQFEVRGGVHDFRPVAEVRKRRERGHQRTLSL